MIYSDHDLQVVNPLDSIRAHPDLYIGVSEPSASVLIGRLASDLASVSGLVVVVTCIESWWIVGANRSWLNDSPKLSVLEYFRKLIPFPEAGQNAFHSEVLFGAFTSGLILFDRNGYVVVKGEVPECVEELVTSPYESEQWLAFRLG